MTTSTRRCFAVLASSTLAALSLAGNVASAAETAQITKVDGNPRCADVQGSQSLRSLKIDPVNQGTTSFNGGSISVNGSYFSFTFPAGVDIVVVKGGPNASIYRYSPEATGGTGLRAPINPDNGKPYGLSHIDFCFDAESTTPAPADPCIENPDGMKADGTPCRVASTDPCAENPDGMRADGTPCTAEERQQISPEPVQMIVVERAENPVRRPTASSKAPAPEGAVLGAVGTITRSRTRVAASASMPALKRCVARPFDAVVNGRGIKRVTMYVNGRKVRAMVGGRTRYVLRVSPAAARGGVIRVQAKVEYVAASGKKAQTFRMTALRCAGGAAPVRFAG